MRTIPTKLLVTSILLRGLVLAALWWILAGRGAWDAWMLPLGTLMAALVTSLLCWPPQAGRLQPLGVLQLAGWFIWQSWRGGVDVARRALRPRMSLQPDFLSLPLRVRGEWARICFVWLVSLLPGTAAVRLENDVLHLHVLDRDLANEENLRALETRVARAGGGS
jgi:multicomponent Na+:H+ antiporter subunit E